MVVVGPGKPKTHPLHAEYARKTLYAYAPCHQLTGTEYLDAAARQYYGGDWATALRAFVDDKSNQWCPTWIRRNYEVENPKVADATATARLQTHLAAKHITYIFDDSEKEEGNPDGEEGVETPRHPGDDDKERQPEETAKLCMEQVASGEPHFQGDEFAPPKLRYRSSLGPCRSASVAASKRTWPKSRCSWSSHCN